MAGGGVGGCCGGHCGSGAGIMAGSVWDVARMPGLDMGIRSDAGGLLWDVAQVPEVGEGDWGAR